MNLQSILGNDYSMEVQTNIDLILVIDATASMDPIIDNVKKCALSFYDNVCNGIKSFNKKINQFRVKVIVFRDYYVDDNLSMNESKFYILPNENSQLKKFVSSIEAKGGGDEPESSLEALALAMRSNFVNEGVSKRHIIVLFTDASAHPFEQAKDGIPQCYPKNMFQNMNELYLAWNDKQGYYNGLCNMNYNAQRLIIFAPKIEPWNSVVKNCNQSILIPIQIDNGGADLSMDSVIKTISQSIK